VTPVDGYAGGQEGRRKEKEKRDGQHMFENDSTSNCTKLD
jgi:hypothetical protein